MLWTNAFDAFVVKDATALDCVSLLVDDGVTVAVVVCTMDVVAVDLLVPSNEFATDDGRPSLLRCIFDPATACFLIVVIS